MIKKAFFLLACFMSIFATAQDIYFNEHNTSKMNLNPAFAGSDSAFVLSSADKFHIGNGPFDRYNSFFFSADNYFRALRGGLAVSYANTRELGGDRTTNQVHLSYAPHFELFNHKLALQPGFEFGVFSNKQKNLVSPPGPDADIPWSGTIVKSNIDFSAGILLFTKQLYGGFAMHHINTPQYQLNSYYQLPIRYTVHAGVNLSAGNFIFSPNIFVINQRDYKLVQIGIRVKYKMFTYGIDLGPNYLIPEVGFQNRFFKLSYCYNYIINEGARSENTHEIHFNWFFKYKNKKQLSLRMI